MQKQNKLKKQNNGGFSLLELLVAVMILAIAAIPLIRSLGTAAITNSKSKILMYSTECAENMMELVEQLTVEELVDQYEVSTENVISQVNGKYQIRINDKDDFPSKLPANYYLEVELDPGKFPNNNALNIADVKSMSILDTAVYEMASNYDESIYSKFERWNEAAIDTDPVRFMTALPGYFDKNLKRTIDININPQGIGTDAEGNSVELVTVELDIRYEFQGDAWKYLPDDQAVFEEETKEIFNNLTTKVPLAGIYLFYQPRCVATQYNNNDVINVYNHANIETNLFLAAQKGDGQPATESIYYSSLTGPIINIEEAGADKASEAAITLFTNLCETAPYSEKDGVDGDVLCQLTYKAPGLLGADNPNAVKALDCRNLDGKNLIMGNNKDRIYKVYARVIDNTNASAPVTVVELDGTKLE